MTAAARRLARTARAMIAPPRVLGRKLFAIAAALLVLTGAIGGGRSYLWCSMMDRAVEACCCDVEHEGDETPASEIKAACCEDRAIGDVDRARVAAETIEVPDALPLAIVGPPTISTAARPRASATPVAAPAARGSPIRAGPRRSADTCIRIQVFRC